CGADTKKKVKFRAFSDSLRPFLALLSHCKALIGNEGGAVNMAKALNIPTFSIFSPWITKAAWDTFADDTNIAVHLNDYKPEIFKGKSKKELQKETREIYPLFKPELYDDRLEHFLSAAITLPNQ
ncbi:MAG: lipopolysaccharide heptosyltransferase family protein, partial [Bacteroidota bacterium]